MNEGYMLDLTPNPATMPRASAHTVEPGGSIRELKDEVTRLRDLLYAQGLGDIADSECLCPPVLGRAAGLRGWGRSRCPRGPSALRPRLCSRLQAEPPLGGGPGFWTGPGLGLPLAQAGR